MAVIAASTADQSGAGDPRALHLEAFFGEPLLFATSGQTHGHNSTGGCALSNPACTGRALGVAAVAWFKIPGLGFVIGLAMICNLIAGALGGILIPMVLNRVRADPAVASGTFVTTITDVVGFFSFLGIATLWFGLK